MANLSKSLELITDLIKTFDGEVLRKSSVELATDVVPHGGKHYLVHTYHNPTMWSPKNEKHETVVFECDPKGNHYGGELHMQRHASEGQALEHHKQVVQNIHPFIEEMASHATSYLDKSTPEDEAAYYNVTGTRNVPQSGQKPAAPSFKRPLATDRALATVRAAPKQPVAPVVPEHEQKLAAAHAKIEELKGVLRGALKHVRRHGQTSDHGYITTSDTGDKWVSHSGGLRGHIEESLK